MYEKLVEQALDQLSRHDLGPLSALVTEIETGALTDAKLAPLLRTLSREISRLDNVAASPLISAVLSLDWSARPAEVVDAILSFLGQLASGIPRWWIDIANKVVSEFVKSPDFVSAHHRVVQHILHIIPTSSTRFEAVFTKHFPHKHGSIQATSNYVANLLKTLEYAPELEKPMWNLIVDKLMQFDVECETEADSESEASSDDENDSNELESDEDDDDVDDDEDDDEDEDRDSTSSSAKRIRLSTLDDLSASGTSQASQMRDNNARSVTDTSVLDDVADGEEITMAEMQTSQEILIQTHQKLDVLMSQVLTYLENKFSADAIKRGSAAPLFITLLDSFKQYILPTHTTRSVQFIMFRISSSHPELLDAFLVSLIELALDPTVIMDKRQKAMQYIASFVARAKSLRRTQIVFVVTFLAAWTSRFIAEREHEVDEGANMARFRMFYSATQALFYIFCFRHSMLRVPGSDTEWEADIEKLFQRIIVTKFNPLKYAKSTVVAMFAKIARRENVAYCFSVMEQNRLGRFRALSNQSSPKSPRTRGSLAQLSSLIWPDREEFVALEGYFPFDPLSLKRTREIIEPFYVEWDDVNEDSDSDSASLSNSDASDSDSESE